MPLSGHVIVAEKDQTTLATRELVLSSEGCTASITLVWRKVGGTHSETQMQAVAEFVLSQLGPIHRIGHDSEPCPSLLGALKADTGGPIRGGHFQVVEQGVGVLFTGRFLSSALGACVLMVILSNQVLTLQEGPSEGLGDCFRSLMAVVNRSSWVRDSKPGFFHRQPMSWRSGVDLGMPVSQAPVSWVR
jgi:hypothetical protein